MKKIKSYAELPFEGISVGRDKIVEFFTDHSNRLKQANADGAPFQKEDAEFSAALTLLTDSKTATAVNLARQSTGTMTVDNYIDQFKTEVTKLEIKVLSVFDKKSAEYNAFFPQGKTAYSKPSKGNIDNLFATLIDACNTYADKLGVEPAEVLTVLRNDYLNARNIQLQKKGSTEETRSAWDDAFDKVKDLAFHNLLRIVDTYRGEPGKLDMFFDQSIITPRNHTKNDTPVPPTE